MEKYPRGTQGPFSIPLLIKAEILFREKCGLGQDQTVKDGLMWAVYQSHCSDALIHRHTLSWDKPLSWPERWLAAYQIHIYYLPFIVLLTCAERINNGKGTNATLISQLESTMLKSV